MATIVAEDGVVNSNAALEKFSFATYDKRTIDFGQQQYPINLYGDTEKKEK